MSDLPHHRGDDPPAPLILRAPSRLHFGLLAPGSSGPRQFGGVGLMIDDPGLRISAEPGPRWEATGPLAGRVVEAAERAARGLLARGIPPRPARFEVLAAPAEHVGLGVGTQVGLGVAALVAELAGLPRPSAVALATLAGRGARSGIGLHGFDRGGFLVDGGRSATSTTPPLLAHLPFPGHWSVLVLIPPQPPGLHGSGEVQAFAALPPFPEALIDRLCRLVLLGLLPGVVEGDLAAFGSALEELQLGVGRGFAPAQGGVYARPESETIVRALRDEGLVGVGQSSWGPALYGFSDAPADRKLGLLARIDDRLGFPPGSAFWSRASASGATVERGQGQPSPPFESGLPPDPPGG